MSRVCVGTSGWTYDDWRGPFYPSDVPKKQWLTWYSGQFATTEVNGSFYRTPSLEAVKAWRDTTPEEFVFAWKASKFITHWKRLSENSHNSLDLMHTRLKILGPKVGPVLFQLPARFKADPKRLRSFLRMLSKRYMYAFEFRDESWYAEETLDLLRGRNVALCLSDHADAPAPWVATAGHVYIRGHGPTGRYSGRYSAQALAKWAQLIRQWRRKGLDVYCYFDNDQKSAAPHDARRLVELLTAKKAARPRRVASAAPRA